MSPDPGKCKIIQNWPQPTSCAEVISFLQTVQFNAKFLSGKGIDLSYPKLTEPLREQKNMPNFIGDPTKVTLFNNLKLDYAVKMLWYPMTLNCPQDYMLIRFQPCWNPSHSGPRKHLICRRNTMVSSQSHITQNCYLINTMLFMSQVQKLHANMAHVIHRYMHTMTK